MDEIRFEDNVGDPTGVYIKGKKVGQFINHEFADTAICAVEKVTRLEEELEDLKEINYNVDEYDRLVEIEKRFDNNAKNKSDVLDSIYEAVEFLDKEDVSVEERMEATKGYFRDIEKKLEGLDLPKVKKKAVRKKSTIKKG